MKKSILIVDDEKNIRLTLNHSLESLGAEIDIAVTGEEALDMLGRRSFDIILLDLKLPGIDGMEVLRKEREINPDTKVIIVTAHGTVDNAVEAMKLGAVDFIQKPFAPTEIRGLVSKVFERESLDEKDVKDYGPYLELAKKEITNRHFDAAKTCVQKAVSIDSSRPEAFNLLGAIMEIRGDYLRAEKYYRAAVSLDSGYQPGKKNLERIINLSPEERLMNEEERGGILGFFSNLFGGQQQSGKSG